MTREEAVKRAKSLSEVCDGLAAEGLQDEVLALVTDRLNGQVPDDSVLGCVAAIVGAAAARSAVSACIAGKGDPAASMRAWVMDTVVTATKLLNKELSS